ncbi:MAG: SRPBCC family protein [Microthrixaceae bacterium]|nr:SRPBCC family protein [Microthrixaceae bacterium]
MSAKQLIECERVGLDYFESAPVSVTATEVVAATPERIFEVFLDADSWSRWAFPITGVDWTSPMPLEVGSTRTVWMRGPMVGHEEFIAWELGRRMAFRFNQTIEGGPSAFAEDYLVTDLRDGRSLVEWTMAMTLTGVSARFARLTGPAMGPVNRAMLRKFRTYVESNPTLAPPSSKT